MIAAGSAEVALAFVEIGAVTLGLAVLARFAGWLGLTAVPFYLIAGLGLGEGGISQLEDSIEFIEIASELGVLLLLFTLGLEYSESELRSGLRTGIRPGTLDMLLNALPGVALGLLLGWEPLAAVLLGGVTWISSSGVVSKVLSDLGRLGYRETPAILNLLVIEDLAMAIYLPTVAALIVGGSLSSTVVSVLIALTTVSVILLAALRFGGKLSDLVVGGGNEALMLMVFGITVLVAGLAQQLEVSGAIGAFLVGLALKGEAAERLLRLFEPLRDLFAAFFFLYFSFQIDPGDLLGVAVPAIGLALFTATTKVITGWYAAGRIGAAPRGRLRAGTALIARGEFSIVIAALGASLIDGPELGAVAAGYVLLTAIIGPVLTKFYDRIPVPARLAARPSPAPAPTSP
ncbi:MAG: cation:proton antiporter [Ilumatobacteraceae bacterium]|nr:cation:proton antiporter [Ilumatobacteraceae bacterium]